MPGRHDAGLGMRVFWPLACAFDSADTFDDHPVRIRIHLYDLAGESAILA